MSELFDRAFALMDTRCAGRLQLASVYEFVDAIEKPPTHQTVKKIYDEFDQDGSGDIDKDEFLGLCQALEKLTQLSIDAMSLSYAKKMYQTLFDLVDDGADAEVRTISKAELKIFLDQSSHIFSNLSSSDVVGIFKQYPQGELTFDDFCEVIGKIIRARPISQIVHAFEEAKRKRLQVRAQAYENFGQKAPVKGGGSKAAAHVEEPAPAANAAAVAPAVKRSRDDPRFQEAFALMDSRGGGSVSLDQVYEFCETLPNPPPQATIRRVYNQFDEDGSGDIDSDEFFSFCEGLEKITSMSVEVMLGHFTRAMYKRLFELVDEGGDGNAMVSKDELKVLLESIGPLLSSKLSASDVVALVRDFPGELCFDDFVTVVKKLTIGKSISQVVTAFEEAKRRRKAALHYAMQRFEGSKKGGANFGGDGIEGRTFCFTCAEKDEKIRDLHSALEQLQSSSGSAAAEALAAARRELDDVPPIGDLRENIHVITAMQRPSYQRKYPEIQRPAMHHLRSQRILSLMDFFVTRTKGSAVDTDGVARLINQNAPKHGDYLDQMRAVVDVVMSEARAFFDMMKQLLHLLGSPATCKSKEVRDIMDMVEIMRDKVKDMRQDGSWLCEQLIEVRNESCNAALCVAPYTNRSLAIVQAALEAEKLTQRFVDSHTALFLLGSDHPTDIENVTMKILADRKAEVTSNELADLEVNLNSIKDLASIDVFNRLFIELQDSMNAMKKLMSTTSASRKDKACMTQPTVESIPQLRTQKKQGDAADNGGGEPGALQRLRSSSPRMRQIKLKPRDPIAQVDRILDSYRRDPQLLIPPNFQRVEAGTNSFQFGTRRIELLPVDRFVAVKVGGGYLMFDEFCNKYCEQENRRITSQIEMSQRTSAAPSVVTSPMTPRSSLQTPRTARVETPRTLVRTPGGLKMV